MIGRRYILRDPLGTGGMGTVYRAFDRLTGQIIALKHVTPAQNRQAETSGTGRDFRLALAQEFKILASLRHPNIISVLDYGFDEQHQPYYTMELLENAQTILEAGAGKPLAERVVLLAQGLRALAYLHRRGITHRDLKPSNVLVVAGQVKVLDFGLSIAAEQREEAPASTAGTLAYMAPEVLMGGLVNEMTDLYAIGVIAYELLAGRHPFDVADVTQLLNQILYDPPDFSALELDPPLQLLLERLLAKSPQARYADANTVIQELGAVVGQSLPLETAATRESFLQAARLVGREAELKQLSAALEAAMTGKGSAWLVAGESGVGKSRLLEELWALALVRGATVLRGQGISERGSPYLTWRPVLRWLSLLTELDDTQLGVLQMLVPDVGALLNRELPPPEVDWKAAQTRLLAVVEAIFRRQQQPIVVILEDLHWAEESLDVLARLAQIVAELPVLLIGSYRDDERPELPQRLPGMNRLRLERLSAAAIAELSEAMLGAMGRQEAVLELLRRETEGNVFFLVEVVRVLAEEAGQLDRIGLITLPVHVFEGGIQQIVQRRLSRVPPEARPLLQLAAIIGRELKLDLLRAVEPAVQLDWWLAACADAAVLDVLDGKWRFAHDKLRDGVLLELTDEARRALHAQVAAAMEPLAGDQPELAPFLAYHFGRAGHRPKEAHYTVLAAAQTLTGGAYREALNWFNRALALTNQFLGEIGEDVAGRVVLMRQQVALKQQMAGARLGLGQYDLARELYQENLMTCRELFDEPGEAEALSHLGSVAQALSDYAGARIYYQQSLNLYRTLNDAAGTASALNSLGSVAYDLGEFETAKQLFQESFSLARETGHQWGAAGTISSNTSITQEMRAVSAHEPFLEGLGTYLSGHSQAALIEAFEKALAANGDTEQHHLVAALFQEALVGFRQAEDRWAEALVLSYLGRLATTAGQIVEAGGHFRAALELAFALPDVPLVLDIIAEVGRWFVTREADETGVELLALALHHPESRDETQDKAERLLFELQSRLPSEALKAGWERGKNRVLAAVVPEILAGDLLSSPGAAHL